MAIRKPLGRAVKNRPSQCAPALHPFSVHIAKRVRAVRIVLRLTQKEVAQGMGCHMKTYQYLEWGYRNWSFVKLLRVAAVMRVPYIKLLEGYKGPTDNPLCERPHDQLKNLPPARPLDATSPADMDADGRNK